MYRDPKLYRVCYSDTFELQVSWNANLALRAGQFMGQSEKDTRQSTIYVVRSKVHSNNLNGLIGLPWLSKLCLSILPLT